MPISGGAGGPACAGGVVGACGHRRVRAPVAAWLGPAASDASSRGRVRPAAPDRPFRRFPTWMWRNEEMRDLVDWLKAHNAKAEPSQQAGFYGLDLYSTSSSMEAVMAYMARA